MGPKVPVWAYIVGIGMILFGTIGLIGNISNVFMSDVVEFQQEFMEESGQGWDNAWDEAMEEAREEIEEERAERAEADSLGGDSLETNLSDEDLERLENFEDFMIDKVPNMVENSLKVSDSAIVWMKRFAIIGIFISIFYILSGIFLFVIRRFSIPLAVTTLIFSLVVSISRMVIFLTDSESGWIIKASIIGEVFAVVADIAFLVVILVANKDAYKGDPEITLENQA